MLIDPRRPIAGIAISPGAFQTPNTRLAAALVACGIPLDPVRPFMEIDDLDYSGPGKKFVWILGPQSLDGVYKTETLVAQWHDENFHLKHPEHPLAYIRAYKINQERLTDLVKGKESKLVQWELKGKILTLPESATPDQEAELISYVTRPR